MMRNREVQNMVENVILDVETEMMIRELINNVEGEYINRYFEDQDTCCGKLGWAEVFCGNHKLSISCVESFKYPLSPTLVFKFKGKKVCAYRRGKYIEGNAQALGEILKTAHHNDLASPYYYGRY